MAEREEHKMAGTPSVAKKAKVSLEERAASSSHPSNKTALAARLVNEWHFRDTELDCGVLVCLGR
jgi:hypothetical protein